MASLPAVQKHQLYVSRRILSDQAQLLVSTKVNDVDSLISSMNDSITPENKSTKRTLSLSIYGESSNAGTLYLNHLVNLDFFNRISAEDQVGLLMEESTVGVKDRNSFLRLTGYLRDQGAVGMITNLQSGMTLFLKPSGHCRAQMYSLSSQFLKTWCLLSARRIAAESEAARIAAQIEATRIAAEVEAARTAAKIEADRIAVESLISIPRTSQLLQIHISFRATCSHILCEVFFGDSNDMHRRYTFDCSVTTTRGRKQCPFTKELTLRKSRLKARLCRDLHCP